MPKLNNYKRQNTELQVFIPITVGKLLVGSLLVEADFSSHYATSGTRAKDGLRPWDQSMKTVNGLD